MRIVRGVKSTFSLRSSVKRCISLLAYCAMEYMTADHAIHSASDANPSIPQAVHSMLCPYRQAVLHRLGMLREFERDPSRASINRFAYTEMAQVL